MAQTLLTFGTTPYSSPYYVIGKEDCINFYLEKSTTPTAKFSHYFVSVPGLKKFSEKSSDKFCRGLYRTASSRLFGVFGEEFVEILQNGSRVVRGTIKTYSGTVNFVDNNYQLMFVDGDKGYVLDLATNVFSQIDEETFPNGATHITNIDTYFIVNVPNTNQIRWSSPNNATIWDPLDYGAKQGSPDNVVAIKELSNQLWVFGTHSTEVHYDTGESNQIWQRLESAVIDVGCVAPNSVQKIENKIFWLGSDKSGNVAIWSNENLNPVKISSRGIEQLIDFEVSDKSKAVGYTYAQAGHVFYIITFEGTNLTLVFDTTTLTWHRRSCLSPLGAETAWRGKYSAYCWSKNIFGDPESNILYEADVDYYQNDLPENNALPQIPRTLTSPVIQKDQKRVRHNSVQVVFEQGRGLNMGFGSDPVCILETSNDSGHSWTNRRTVEIGKIGEYAFRSRFLCLGISRNRCYKIRVTDPIEVILAGLVLDVQELDLEFSPMVA